MLIGCHIPALICFVLCLQICTQTNTFQCILITDGTNSFVIFLYADDRIQWSVGDVSRVDAQAGFNAGDGEFHFTISGSRTPAIVDIETTSNIGVPGKYLFRVDNETISTPPPRKEHVYTHFTYIHTYIHTYIQLVWWD